MFPNDIMDIVKNIKELRLKKSINQQDLADALSVDVSVISNIELGKREIRFREIEKIANVLGISVVDLITYPKKYVELKEDDDQDVETVLMIKLKENKKRLILKSIFSDENLELLNK